MANASSQTHQPPTASMGIQSSVQVSQSPKPSSSLNDLHEEILAHLLAYLPPRDVESITVASKRAAHDVVPCFPIWKAIFCYRWQMLNFPLQSDASGNINLDIDERVRALFPEGLAESRIYQLLAHAVTPVPSFVDVRATERARRFSVASHTVESVVDAPRRQVVDIAYRGRYLGGDRCVRSNVPFEPIYHTAVYAVEHEDKTSARRYRVGITASGYFEISIRTRNSTPPRRTSRRLGDDMTSIGIGSHSFPLIGKQPGWDRHSIGYHGDDGRLFNRHEHGRHFSVPYGVGDTVGCGVRRDIRTSRSFAFFTNNGDRIPNGDMDIECSHGAWFPVAGLDSLDHVHFNFGQEPFVYEDAVDELLSEAEGESELLASQLLWFDIHDSDAESSSSEEEASHADETDRREFEVDDLQEYATMWLRLIGELRDDHQALVEQGVELEDLEDVARMADMEEVERLARMADMEEVDSSEDRYERFAETDDDEDDDDDDLDMVTASEFSDQ